MDIVSDLISIALQLEKKVAGGGKLAQPEREILESISKTCWAWVELATTCKDTLEANKKLTTSEIRTEQM